VIKPTTNIAIKNGLHTSNEKMMTSFKISIAASGVMGV
jgi:hypothetical protein